MNAKQMRSLGTYLNGPIDDDEWMHVEENVRTRSVTIQVGEAGDPEVKLEHRIEEDGEFVRNPDEELTEASPGWSNFNDPTGAPRDHAP